LSKADININVIDKIYEDYEIKKECCGFDYKKKRTSKPSNTSKVIIEKTNILLKEPVIEKETMPILESVHSESEAVIINNVKNTDFSKIYSTEDTKSSNYSHRIKAIAYNYKVNAKIAKTLSRKEMREIGGKNYEKATDTIQNAKGKNYKVPSKLELEIVLNLLTQENETLNKKAIDLIKSDLNKLNLI
jgi:ribosomal protein L22